MKKINATDANRGLHYLHLRCGGATACHSCETVQEMLLSGAYLVKIGDAPARRIVVRR